MCLPEDKVNSLWKAIASRTSNTHKQWLAFSNLLPDTTRNRTKRKTDNRNRPGDDPFFLFLLVLEMDFNIALIIMFKNIDVKMENCTRYLVFIFF